MRPTIEPSTALGLPRRSWWRSGSSSMRSSSIASRSAGETGRGERVDAGLERLVVQQPRAQALEGRDRRLLGGRAAEPLLDPLAQRVGGRREHEDALRGPRASPGRSASQAKRSTSAVVLPVPAPPMTSKRSAAVLDGFVLGGGEHFGN